MKTASPSPAKAPSPARAVDLRCEFAVNPLGIGETQPRLSWRMDDDRNAARQTAYRLVAATTLKKLDAHPDLWDTGVVEGDQCLDVVYAGKPLKARAHVFWKVRIADADGAETDWSEPASFELGLLGEKDWTAGWIGRKTEGDGYLQPSPFLRRAFRLASEPVSARLYATALGLFEMRLNGAKVGGDFLTPGWTLYLKRAQSFAYDVTPLLRKGPNVLGGILGTGWYTGSITRDPSQGGKQLALRAQLEILCADGSKVVIATDPSWKTAFGPIVSSDIYHGEHYDATREMDGWDSPGFRDAGWTKALEVAPPRLSVDPARSLPIRAQQELAPVACTEPRPGEFVYDFGQNMVGLMRVTLRAPRGTRVRLRFGEMLNPDGTLYTENLRSAKVTDTYVCCGGGAPETYVQRFTFHGFRYAEITGLKKAPGKEDVAGIVLHSEMEQTGWFACSNPLVNQLQSNISWGQRGNYLDVPTDCPQRDERLGWTGDAQVFIRTAAFNRNVAGFFTKWCLDLEDSQSPGGAFPHFAPNLRAKADGPVIEDDFAGGASAWADAGVVCPWNEYLCYGDRRLLERRYAGMLKWIDWQEERSADGILDHALFGDWLALDVWSLAPRYDRQLTPRPLISTACFARTTAIVEKAAKVLGKDGDARRLSHLHARIKAAFNREFVTPSGRLVSETQTAYLLALAYDLLPAGLRDKAMAHLARKFAEHKDHLSTGFVGTPLIGPVLSRFGRADLAYKVLLQKTYPGWLFSVLQGATTMWERWNSYTVEAGFGDASMNSFNHYAYGAIGEWLYATVAGIELDEDDPAFHHVVIQPCPPPEIRLSAPPEDTVTWAEGRLMTRYGLIVSRWEATPDGRLVFSFTIPPNTTATVCLPGLEPYDVPAGSYTVEE